MKTKFIITNSNLYGFSNLIKEGWQLEKGEDGIDCLCMIIDKEIQASVRDFIILKDRVFNIFTKAINLDENLIEYNLD